MTTELTSESKQFYFITGLPRSRTAWLANYLTWRDSFCYHDGFADLDSVRGIYGKLHRTPGRFVGNSDPANLLLWKQLVEWFPEAKWVVVKRDLEQSFLSSKKALGIQDRVGLELMQEEMKSLCRFVTPLVIPYDSLDCFAQRIPFHLGIDAGPAERLDLLLKLQVQIEPVHLRAAMDRLSQLPAPWFRKEAA